jgi:predicted RND superfamily exporter protein
LAGNIDDKAPVIANLEEFDLGSGSIVERILFNNRPIILGFCVLVTLFLGFQALHVKLNASFEKMIPTSQPFIVNFLHHYDDLQSQGNAVRIIVQANQGTIINAHYLAVLQKISDQVYLMPNVDRAYMTSLWTPATRWTTITANGIGAGPVMADTYDGSPAQLAIVQKNIINTGGIGSLVSNDFTASTIYVPLLTHDGLTGKTINYGQFAKTLNQMRATYASQGVTLHIIGFAMIVGDMINSIDEILLFFGISAVIALVFLFWYTRCVRSTLLVVTASLIAVIWQMGFLPLLGYDLTPYSVLVPFLVFAIGMSHGAQKMNGVMQDIGRGTHPLIAARYTFRRLFLAGFSALVCDASSFAVLMTIHIEAIRELALIASIGVAILVFTNLIMLPLTLSYTGVSKKAAIRSLRDEDSAGGQRVSHPLWDFLDLFTTRRFATIAICVAAVLAVSGFAIGRHVQVGDLDKGAPELRQNSQYNRDNAYIVDHFSTSSDTFVILVDTPIEGCDLYPALTAMDRLQWKLQQLPGVQTTSSIATFMAYLMMLFDEGSPKWGTLVLNQDLLGNLWSFLPRQYSSYNCDFDPITISLKDHKASTLTAVVSTVQDFIKNPANQGPNFKISLAGGNAGIDAATNIVIKQANNFMLVLVYTVVIFFCFVVFKSWRAVLCAVIPLVVTSILAQALMVILGIGIKVATLPVIALGVGIGVDYALYVLGIVIKQLRVGASLSDAYHRTLLFTGRVVLLTGFTLAAGVVTWVFAPIKFQADMGLLLAFMFLWNMLGALVLLPSLAYFLLPPRLFKQQDAAPPNMDVPVLLETTH